MPNLTVIDGAIEDLIVGEAASPSASIATTRPTPSMSALSDTHTTQPAAAIGGGGRDEWDAGAGAAAGSGSTGGGFGPAGGVATMAIRGVELLSGVTLSTPSVVITTGTFLRGVLHIGQDTVGRCRLTLSNPC